MRRTSPLQHARDRFAADPTSVRNAAYVMIVITVGTVLVGGVVVWVFDARDFPDLGGALWYTLQTVTTVGYGDKVPTEGVGRLVGHGRQESRVQAIDIDVVALVRPGADAFELDLRLGQPCAEVGDEVTDRPVGIHVVPRDEALRRPERADQTRDLVPAGALGVDLRRVRRAHRG